MSAALALPDPEEEADETDDGSDEASGGVEDGEAEREYVDTHPAGSHPQVVDAVPAAVDPPAEQLTLEEVTGWNERERKLIVPRWLKDWSEFKFVVRWLIRYALYWLTYHGTRSPKYLFKATIRLLVGTTRSTVRWLDWLLDSEGRPVRQDASKRKDADALIRLRKQRDQTVHKRLLITAGYGVVGLGAALVGVVYAPWYVQGAAVVAAVTPLVRAGAPLDEPLFDVLVSKPGGPIRLTSRMVNAAFGSLGVKGINDALSAGRQSLEFVAPICREGPGWRADIQLPLGVTVAQIMDRRESLASGLRRPLGCVWPEPLGEDNPGRLCLWVGDKDLAKTKQSPWPLLKAGRVDLFDDFPFGTDQRGRVISLCLMFSSMLIGAMPRFGKTFAVRLVLLACALDVRVELRVWELKGTGDLRPLSPIAHRYGSGADDETVEAVLDDMADLYRELDRRAKRLAKLPAKMVPENKLTSEVASRRDLGLYPIVWAVDECQELYGYGDKKQRDETARMSAAIHKRGPALGIIAINATQRPTTDSIPTSVSSNALIRFCLKVMGQIENDVVLGTSKYQVGIRATMFHKRDKGIGWLDGHQEDAQITRTFYVDGPTADQIVVRARAAREVAGVITGHAAGEVFERPESPNLLDDLATIFVPCERLHSYVICEKLRELRPETYSHWTEDTLPFALPPGMNTRQIKIDGENRRGLRRQQVIDAVARREGLAGLGPGDADEGER